MSTTPPPSPAPQDKPPRKAHQRRRQQSVVQYIAVLFAAAFVLMGMSYIMERRQNAQEVDTLKKQSTSAMQSVENLIQENEQLKRQVEELTQQLNETEANHLLTQEELTHTQSDAANTAAALDWFWQIDEAYVKSKWSLCRKLIQTMPEGLAAYLPQESVTDNGRFSPADRYAEIRQKVLHE